MISLGSNSSLTSLINFIAIGRTCAGVNLLNSITASKRLRNSGLKCLLTASVVADAFRLLSKPILLRSPSLAPKLLVMIRTMLRQLTVLPLLLVNMPLSMTPNKIFNTSGCAFSTSSNNKIALGFSSKSLINLPDPASPSP